MMLSFGYTKPYPPTHKKLSNLEIATSVRRVRVIRYSALVRLQYGRGWPRRTNVWESRSKSKSSEQVQLDNKFTAMRGSRYYRPEPLPSAEITVQLRCRMIAPICVVITRDKSCSTRLWKEMFSQLFRNETVHNLVFTYSMVWGRTCYWTGALALSRGHRSQNHSWERLNNLRIHLYAM